ncbi:toprim domain-containing protein [uncultured Hymenobacter sp.]|uniref:toprim domain-containing protein n=1 Tax=uncultured Hymenobacter sp. TaxID=170016 RepID=UPI0035CC113B
MSSPLPLSAKAARAADKQVSLLHLMARLGHRQLGHSAGGNHFFISPFRPDEQTPSFVVSEHKNVWADFGMAPDPGQKAAGGDVLKLVMLLTGFALPQARQVLRSWAADLATPQELAGLPPVPKGRQISSGRLTFEDVRTEPLQWAALTQYLTGRGIDWGLVQRSQRLLAHLQQIFYRPAGSTREKPYFGLGWKTAAGWEVRSPKFQGTIGGKGLTWLPGREPGVVVFEGFMDYLSALTYYKRPYFNSTVLVLNSVSLLMESLPQLLEAPVVHWFGDNDAAGERALRLLRQALPAGRVQAHNELYRGYKDFNDFLTKTPPSKPLPPRRAEPSKLSQTASYWLWAVFQERAPGTPAAAGIQRKCTFYSYTNDAAGLEYLRVLRNRLGEQLAYYRICERTHGRQYRILEWAGYYQPVPVTAS